MTMTAPTGFTATALNAGAMLSWVPPVDPVASYFVRASAGPEIRTYEVTADHQYPDRDGLSIAGLSNDVAWTLVLSAISPAPNPVMSSTVTTTVTPRLASGGIGGAAPSSTGVFAAHHGTRSLCFTAGATGPNVLTVRGPSIPAQGDAAKHLGMFAIDQIARTVSAQVQMACPDRNVWVQPVARYFFSNDGVTVTTHGPDPLGVPVLVQRGGPWTEINVFAVSRSEASHWLLDLAMYDDQLLTMPLPTGAQVYFDCCYVAENGLDLRQHPYLDGDQPDTQWEYTVQDSTSIQRPPVVLLPDPLPQPDPPVLIEVPLTAAPAPVPAPAPIPAPTSTDPIVPAPVPAPTPTPLPDPVVTTALFAGHIPNRVLVGMASPADNASSNPGWTEARALIGQPIYEARRFDSGTFSATVMSSMMAEATAAQAYPVITFKYNDWQAVLNGDHDADFIAWCTWAKAWRTAGGAPYAASIDHEPAGSGITNTDLGVWGAMQARLAWFMAGRRGGTATSPYVAANDVSDIQAWAPIGNGFWWIRSSAWTPTSSAANAAFPQATIDALRLTRGVLLADFYDISYIDMTKAMTNAAYRVPATSGVRTSPRLTEFLTWGRQNNAGAMGCGEFGTIDGAELTNCWKVIRENRDKFAIATYFNSGANSDHEWRLIPSTYPNGNGTNSSGLLDLGGNTQSQGRLNAFKTMLTESVSATYTRPL